MDWFDDPIFLRVLYGKSRRSTKMEYLKFVEENSCFSDENSVEDDSALNLYLPPLFDDYGDGEVVVSGFEAPCYSLDDGCEFSLISEPDRCVVDHIKLQDPLGCYLAEFQAKRSVATTRRSSCSDCLFGNKHVLSLNNKQIVLKPLSPRAAGAMHSGCKNMPSLTMLAMDAEFESEVDKMALKSSSVVWSVDFYRPPIFDDYGDEAAVVANVTELYYSFDSDFEFGLLANSSKNTFGSREFHVQPSYSLVKLQTKGYAAIVLESASSMYLFEGVGHDELIRLVHGGRWGGWHKGFSKFRMLEPGVQDGSFLSSSLLWVFVVQVTCLLILVFDPGGLKLRELRSILF